MRLPFKACTINGIENLFSLGKTQKDLVLLSTYSYI